MSFFSSQQPPELVRERSFVVFVCPSSPAESDPNLFRREKERNRVMYLSQSTPTTRISVFNMIPASRPRVPRGPAYIVCPMPADRVKGPSRWYIPVPTKYEISTFLFYSRCLHITFSLLSPWHLRPYLPLALEATGYLKRRHLG